MTHRWQTKKLGEVCVVDKRQGVYKNLPYVGLEHIEPHTGRFVGSTEPLGVKSSTFKFSPEHLLYGRLRPYLNKVMLPNFEGHCSTEIFPLKTRPELSREFLQYWFLSDAVVEQIDATSTGARMPRANMNAVLDFEVPIPPLPEQQRIVGILDEAFKHIATAKANSEKNLQNARAIFSSELEAISTRNSAHFASVLLSEILAVQPRNGWSPPAEFQTGTGFPVLTLSAVTGFEYDGTRVKLSSAPVREGAHYWLEKGQLLISRSNTRELVGHVAIFDGTPSPAICPDLIMKMTVDNAKADTRFVYFSLRTQAAREYIISHAHGASATMPKIGKGVVQSIPIALPPLLQQRAIVSKLDALLQYTRWLESLFQQKLAALEALKRSLLHQAFKGGL